MPTAASYRSSERPRTVASWESQKKVSVGRRQLRNDNHTRLCSTPRPPARTPSSALLTPSEKGLGSPFPGHHPEEMKLPRTSLTSPFSVCPRVKNTAERPFQLQGQAAVQTTQGEVGAQDSRPQLAGPGRPRRLAREELNGDQLWLIAQAPKFSPSPSHPRGIVNLRAAFNKTKATWNYMQVWFSTYLLNLLGMWPPVSSAGFPGFFTTTPPLNSLSFKRIPCFCSSSSQGWVSQPGLGRSWVTAGSPSPLPGTRSGEAGGRGAGTTKKLQAALGG